MTLPSACFCAYQHIYVILQQIQWKKNVSVILCCPWHLLWPTFNLHNLKRSQGDMKWISECLSYLSDTLLSMTKCTPFPKSIVHIKKHFKNVLCLSMCFPCVWQPSRNCLLISCQCLFCPSTEVKVTHRSLFTPGKEVSLYLVAWWKIFDGIKPASESTPQLPLNCTP